jgi:hypothetical protein
VTLEKVCLQKFPFSHLIRRNIYSEMILTLLRTRACPHEQGFHKVVLDRFTGWQNKHHPCFPINSQVGGSLFSHFRKNTILFFCQVEWQKTSSSQVYPRYYIFRKEVFKSTLKDKDLWVVWKLFQPENILLQISQAQSMNVGHPN